MHLVSGVYRLRLRKLAYALFHPPCWSALALGVVPGVEHQTALKGLGFDGIIDVGANRGQFTLAMRLCLPNVPVVAFEPVPSEARAFRKVHAKAVNVTLIDTAVGETAGEAILHLSNCADSSSLLPIGREHIRLYPDTAEVGKLTVLVKRLDDFAGYWHGKGRQLLKLDVQGFELQVLRGALNTLDTCAHVYVECSEVSLYDGQSLRSEVQAFLEGAGFRLAGCFNPTLAEGKLVQADYLFSR